MTNSAGKEGIHPPFNEDTISSNRYENLQRVRGVLFDELAKSHAPVTGRRVACVLQNGEEIFSGHNYEHTDPVIFEHAEERALQQLLQGIGDVPLQKVYVAGTGQGKIKQVSPCSECYDALSPHFTLDTQLILFQPGSVDNPMIFSFDEHQRAYAPKSYSAIDGFTRDEIVDQLKEKTLLHGRDLEFVVDLRLLGLQTGIQFYLTGTASGRGAMGQLIHEKEGRNYRDIDLIAVTPFDREAVEKLLEDAMRPYYGVLEKRSAILDVWFINETRKNTYYSSGENEIIDFAVAPTLRGAMIRMDYLRKNFFHQVS